MTISLASPPDGARQRQSRVVAACLRAAYAWSERESRPGAMREIARMTGVVMEALGPGRGPASPMQLVECLRRPLGELVTLAGEEPGSADDAIAAAVLLDGDRLADAVYDMACEYAQQLTTAAETAAWLPSWTRMRAEQVENEAFSALVESGDKDAYTRARRLIIEYPAGEREELSAQIVAARARCPVKYSALSADQQYTAPGGSWWWPCPACRWPMAVTGETGALPVPAPPGRLPGRPGTGRVTAAAAAHRRPRPGQRAAGTSRPESAVCVDPGRVALHRRPRRLGTQDRHGPGEAGRRRPDVAGDGLLRPARQRGHAGAPAGRQGVPLSAQAHRGPPQTGVPRAAVLLPKSCEHQADLIAAALPSVTVITETMLRRQVRQAAARRNP